jgi:hypothetical protein
MDIFRQQLGHTRPEMTMRYTKRSQAKLTNLLENRRASVVDFASHKRKPKYLILLITMVEAAGVEPDFKN